MLSTKDAFPLLVQEINKLGSEQEKATAISAIFGSQGEDSGYKVIKAMGEANLATGEIRKSFDDAAGASDKLNGTAKDTVTLQSAMNNLSLAAAEVGGGIRPIHTNGSRCCEKFRSMV